jgi:hypothetical protein
MLLIPLIRPFIALLLCTGLCAPLCAQEGPGHYLAVHFIYGSKPARGHKHDEMKFFGGLHGGHSTIELDSVDYGFVPSGRVHLFAHRKTFNSMFVAHKTHGLPVYPAGDKTITIIIPLTEEQYQTIISKCESYCDKAPYDYAFFGMRCAASAKDILQQAGIFKKRSHLSTVITTFYPKKLRKRLLRMAEKKHYTVIRQEGRPSRKWERD